MASRSVSVPAPNPYPSMAAFANSSTKVFPNGVPLTLTSFNFWGKIDFPATLCLYESIGYKVCQSFLVNAFGSFLSLNEVAHDGNLSIYQVLEIKLSDPLSNQNAPSAA